MSLHAHMISHSRDCDGDYSHGHIYEMTTLELAATFGDLEFKGRVIVNTITLHGTGTLTVIPQGVAWYENTDEGFRQAEVIWCEDECATTRSWQRDHRAESMGY